MSVTSQTMRKWLSPECQQTLKAWGAHIEEVEESKREARQPFIDACMERFAEYVTARKEWVMAGAPKEGKFDPFSIDPATASDPTYVAWRKAARLLHEVIDALQAHDLEASK